MREVRFEARFAFSKLERDFGKIYDKSGMRARTKLSFETLGSSEKSRGNFTKIQNELQMLDSRAIIRDFQKSTGRKFEFDLESIVDANLECTGSFILRLCCRFAWKKQNTPALFKLNRNYKY